MESKIIKSDFKKLNKFIAGLGQKYALKVGIFGDKTSRKNVERRTYYSGKTKTVTGKSDVPETNAELGFLHEYGSYTKRIPARSFLRMPLHQKTNQILEETSKGAEKILAEGNMLLFMKRLGLACENAIQRAFASRGFGMWKPNSPVTIELKGSSAPLIDSAQLRRSIASKVE